MINVLVLYQSYKSCNVVCFKTNHIIQAKNLVFKSIYIPGDNKNIKYLWTIKLD